jgi:hypothetical protein
LCKEKVVTDSKVLPWQSQGEVGKDHENVSHDGYKSDRDFKHVKKKSEATYTLHYSVLGPLRISD